MQCMQCCLLVLPKSGHAPLIDSLVHNGVKGLLSSFHKFKVRFISTAYCSLDDNCKFIQRSRGDCRNVAKKDALDKVGLTRCGLHHVPKCDKCD